MPLGGVHVIQVSAVTVEYDWDDNTTRRDLTLQRWNNCGSDAEAFSTIFGDGMAQASIH